MYYEPYGPYFLPRTGERTGNWRATFWKAVEKDWKGLSTANGVYVFSLRFGDRFTPWYVGKTCTYSGFSGEVFQEHKLAHYREIESMRRGAPCLHFVARVETERLNFCRYSDRAWDEIERVETYLIELALAKNPDLKNDRKTKFHRALDIAGVRGPKYAGRRTNDATTLRNALGL